MGSIPNIKLKISPEELQGSGLDEKEAAWLSEKIAGLKEGSPSGVWQALSKTVLTPHMPFELHRTLYAHTYRDWDEQQLGPRPAWIPSEAEKARTNLAKLLPGDDLKSLHHHSIHAPEIYWPNILSALRINFHKPPKKMVRLVDDVEKASWFPDSKLNIATSCFDRRRSGDVVLIWQKEGGSLHRMKRQELQARVRQIAVALREAGFEPGDAVGLQMPMTMDAICIYLGIVWAGCVVVSIDESLSGKEAKECLDIVQAKGLFTQRILYGETTPGPLYEELVEAQAPKIILCGEGQADKLPVRPEDLAWDDFLALAKEDEAVAGYAPYIALSDAVTNIHFSFAEGQGPKAVPWTQVTPIKAAADAWAHQDIQIGDVVAWPSNLGSMTGPWLIYAALLNGGTIALFEGAAHDRAFGEFVEEAQVNMLGVSPSLVRAWRTSGCMSGLAWESIKCFSSTGEPSNEEDMHWLMAHAGYKPVIEYCGGSEIGGGCLTGSLVQPQAPATFSTKAMGTDFLIINESGEETKDGELALVPPLLGSSSTLLNQDHHEAYFAGMPKGPKGQKLRRHGDSMTQLPGGYFRRT
ncbi:MAG: AMP-dependent synthetase [Myxococcales bacterium]|nr:AMP-dependent synthetase [Myxococcales bacterium]|tara:strand:- start:3453 stop:5192 length:1740 start_codon:yes stop_codon:yes gene_type:complete